MFRLTIIVSTHSFQAPSCQNHAPFKLVQACCKLTDINTKNEIWIIGSGSINCFMIHACHLFIFIFSVSQKYMLLVALVASVSAADLEVRAKLLASKTVLNQFIVQNKDLSIVYKVFNVGSSSAYNVALNDASFPATDFKVVKGQSSVKWNSIPPNGNVTHVLVLQPLKAGSFNFTAAQLSYEITEGGDRQV